jgi:type IV fimbrial biogenesis protein FimT
MKRKQHGFTLVELLVTLAVLAILISAAAPAFHNVTLNNKLRSHSNNIVASVLLARSEAIKRNGVVRMCISADGATCAAGGNASWEQGWVVYHDTGNTGTLDTGDDPIIRHENPASHGFKILSSVKSLSFQPSGTGASQATLKVCRATPNVGSQERQVTISATGRTSVATTKEATCS